MTEYRVMDASRSRYFMMPNVLDDIGLSVYAFRLYSHYKRVAGENGTCWQSVKTMSEKCNMSMGSITNARRELEENELITVKEVPNPTGKAFLEVTITDVWDKNKAGCSPHEWGYSPHEQPTSPHEIKNTPFKNYKKTAKNAVLPTYYQPCNEDGQDLTPQQELKLKQQHPAYIAYYHVTKKRPKNELIDMIIQKIGDFPDQSNLEACRLEWLSRGYNPMSLKWLDWYVSGIPGYQKKDVQSSNDAILKQAMEGLHGS